jgi:2,3,4,5-tetrahydropyridine-2-carboxylate N-succinyltransferase
VNWQNILNDLTEGKTRAAYFDEKKNQWVVNLEVKQAILEAFKAGTNALFHDGGEAIFVDKDTLPPQHFPLDRGVRMVPRGSSVRHGAFIASGVIIMPPSFVNVGAYVDQGSMIDSHVLVGSCAQIGKKVHLSAGVQIGGVLEPIGQAPVIIEDEAFIGANSVIVEGIRVGKRAVLAPGVILSRGVSIYDAVNQKVLVRGSAVPDNAVVVPGVRKLGASHAWSDEYGLHVSCPIIIKYRDEKSEVSLVLEEALRN